MTRLTPEAIAWREMLERESPNWPPELVEAATHMKCELDLMRLKHWESADGPRHLRKYMDRFEQVYAAWKQQYSRTKE